jgi:hypothetical membrane protein
MRMLALGGIAGPVVFSTVTLAVAALRPGYSHATDVISELGATGTPYAALMNYVGFVPAGLMIAVFGIALSRAVAGGHLSILAAGLVTVFGCGMAASGVFSCDAGCPRGEGSLENGIHMVIAPPIFACFIAGVAILGNRFRSMPPPLGPLATYSLATSALALLFMIALVLSLESRTFSGIWQRLMVASLFLWSAVVAVRAGRNTRSDADSLRPRNRICVPTQDRRAGA